MAFTQDRTTYVCLFHHQDQADAAVNDLQQAGVPQGSISVLGGKGYQPEHNRTALAELGIPERDQNHLQSGLNDGGVLVSVIAAEQHLSEIEKIFRSHKAEKIDEAATEDTDGFAAGAATGAALGAATTEDTAAIPIVEEELNVGKRTVDQGGVRLYRRIVEIPVDESVNLREEHVSVDRVPVDRAVTEQDLALAGDRTIELTETAEEAVISKNARVVEEIRLGKNASERTEHITDTVRRTEVEIEELGPDNTRVR